MGRTNKSRRCALGLSAAAEPLFAGRFPGHDGARRPRRPRRRARAVSERRCAVLLMTPGSVDEAKSRYSRPSRGGARTLIFEGDIILDGASPNRLINAANQRALFLWRVRRRCLPRGPNHLLKRAL